MSGVRFVAGRIVFGEGDERWSVPDPTTTQHSDGRHAARYPPPNVAPNYSVADQAETYTYFVAVCQTTELAVAKLREIRRALREKPDDATEDIR